ncbi:MAG: Ribulose-phosphate 3-epimerase [Actinobacteria bacterium]|nr:Ribulose-phosphate 3-epimerase [Actinomycetota bacterium]
MKIKISPSILSADLGCLANEIRKVEEGGADYLHIDVIDGVFAPNISFGPPLIKSIRKYSALVFDVHLMIVDPERYLDEFVEAGSDIITVHIEALKDPSRIICRIRGAGAKPSISLKPATSLSTVKEFLDEIDMLLVMTVDPGFSGQSFKRDILPKIREARRMIDQLNREIDLQVDGGINKESAPLVVEAGANVLVAASAIFGAPDVEKAIREIRESCSP